MPWEKSYCEFEVLDSATRAFWAKGYEATSMADLVKATGINRGSIYTAFSDKRSLFMRVLEHYDQTYCSSFLDGIQAQHPGKEAILAVFEVASARGDGLPGGCLLINTALEMSPHDEEIAGYVDGRMRDVEDFFHDRIVEAVTQGVIARAIEPRETAQALLGMFIGIRVLTRSHPRQAAIAAITAQARRMLS